ncbi:MULTISPECIES: DEAD/DEAH box helicase [unclassified Bradyrhizobium]|uniref:DEAD/DEAH box helicase n=1 Tax=Bradyrhizobium TaxID=374 RepID=UPI0028F0C476|nr:MULTISPECIES: DEAD/DEAH box helicase [unclassified Bradyrhizobium]
MAARFRSRIDLNGIHVSLVHASIFGKKSPIRYADWDDIANDRRVLRNVKDLVEDGAATATDTEVLLPSVVAATLSPEIADGIGLPPLVPLGLAVALDGRIESPEGRIHLRWTDRSGRQLRPERTGVLLRWGEQAARLSAPLYRVAEAAEAYNRTKGRPIDERVAGWMPMQTALAAATDTEVQRDGYLGTFTLYQAGSFALDIQQVEEGIDFTPILMSRQKPASLLDEAPADDLRDRLNPSGESYTGSELRDPLSDALLSSEDHRAFLEQAIRKSGATKDAYVLGKNRYVLIDAALKRALDVVKAKRSGPQEERLAFLRNPRAVLCEALGSDTDETSTAILFIDTKNYSDRVDSLGIWQRPYLPWLTRAPNQWLPEAGWVADGSPVDPPPLSVDELKKLEDEVEAAEARGDPHVVIRGIPIPLDAAPKVLEDERRRTATATDHVKVGSAKADSKPAERLVLVIKKTNFDGKDYFLALRRREALIEPTPPTDRMGQTPLKLHQHEGFRWLVSAWRAGWPGVLLADDMGLGKTYQTLAFLAWIKSNSRNARRRGIGSVADGPLLVVAPTALLKNWERECAERLSVVGLGQRIDAYGHALRKIKLDPSHRDEPGETLDVAKLRGSDWILTTYETLTDHERAFARIPYAVVVFDEMQKVKAPDTLNTKAARTLNADFVLGLTGTPIENRMEDLWCIFDRLVPGYLDDLKTFSRTYREDAPDKLTELKKALDTPIDGAPAVMKRRMKVDILDGLPNKREQKYATPMPPEQAQAYRELIAEAHKGDKRAPGFMLRILHEMRGISLHPHDPAGADTSERLRFEAFARQSARLSTTMQILREIAQRREKALVFIEDIAMQEVVSKGAARLFDLERRPAIINGGTPGEKRLAIVDAFELSRDGFGLLVLSPKAAGVGLNIVSANHVIHLSRWWNPAVEDQCNDRVYRIGQTKAVTIHLPMAVHPDFPGGSFDEALDRLIEKKRQLSRHMLAPPTSQGDVETLFGGAVPGS